MPINVDAVVVSNDRLSANYNIVKLAAPAIAAQCLPGQFVMVKRGYDTDPLLRRPFSVFEVLRDRRNQVVGLSLLNKHVGVMTRAIFEVQPGDRIQCLGPLGNPFSMVDPPSEAWMVAGGVGLAPFVTLAPALRDRRSPATLFYGGRTAADLFHLDFFEGLGVGVVLTTEDGSKGEGGRVTAPLERALKAFPSNAPLTIYACGPTPMMRAVAQLGNRYHRPTEVSLEPVMGCGLGGCYSCVVRLRRDNGAGSFVRSCLEGPVFKGDQILWDELLH